MLVNAILAARMACACAWQPTGSVRCAPALLAVYGYDILIDESLKPWLIEVNASPSLTADTPQDYELKFGLLDDVYSVIDVEGKLGGAQEECVGGFDLIYSAGGPVRNDKSVYSTRLGCFDDRVRQLRKLHKQHAKRQQQAAQAAQQATH